MSDVSVGFSGVQVRQEQRLLVSEKGRLFRRVGNVKPRQPR